MNEIKVVKVNVDLFKDFLNKLVGFDKNVYIKINADKVSSHVYFPNKDAVKIVELNTEDLFEFSKPLDQEIKVAFYNAKDIMTALNFFTIDNIKGKIQYSDKDGERTAVSFILESDEEKFKLFCLDPNLSFIEMEDNEVEIVFETEGLNTEDSDHTYFANFEIDHEMIKKIDSRLKINKDESKFTLQITDGKAYVITRNNELLISEDIEIVSDSIDSVTLFQKYLSLLDRENYRVFLCSNKLVFESLVSDTKLAIASSLEEDDLDDMDDLNTANDLADLDDLDDLQIDM